MSQSPMLTRFYQEYLAWVEAGAPTEYGSFKPYWGLCSNLQVFSFAAAQDDIREPCVDYCEELSDQFRDAGLHPEVPFNTSRHDYSDETSEHLCYTNEERLAWVRKHAALGEHHA